MQPTTVDLKTKVIGGAIQNATSASTRTTAAPATPASLRPRTAADGTATLNGHGPQQASAALASAVGQADVNGGSIMSAAVDRLAGLLPSMVDACTGRYSIEPVGDACVMRFAGVPAEAAALTYTRIFVERGGNVYYGYRDKLRVDNAVRLNAQGMDALFAPLGQSR